MTTTPVSVIVVSRGRPDALTRCLTGLSQLLYPTFEIIVVADPAGLAALDSADWTGRIKIVPFDEPNISTARNAGIAQAAGDALAFIDDDAVPEPTWLSHLVAPFGLPEVSAAGGFVRGPTGIGWQTPPLDVRNDGSGHLITLPEDAPTLFTGQPGRGIKTEGTNMAFRANVLRDIGGFDSGFAFYLDETDLNLRLAAIGATTAIVPQAVVHHGLAASIRRRADRVPLTLADVGASLAIFARKHRADPAKVLANELATRRRGLTRQMVTGRIEPRDMWHLLVTLRDGWARGMAHPLTAQAPLNVPDSRFLPFARLVADQGHRVLACRPWQTSQARAQAADWVAQGWRVSLFVFSPTAQAHKAAFSPQGFWEQRGGLFGSSDGPRPTARFQRRLQAEVIRITPLRQGLQNP